MQTTPFTPEKRFWLLTALLNKLGIEQTKPEIAADAVAYGIDGCNLIIQGAVDAPTLLVEYEGQQVGQIFLNDDELLKVVFHLEESAIGDCPDLEAPLQFMLRLLTTLRQLIRDYDAMR